jgi:hypothetical protein
MNCGRTAQCNLPSLLRRVGLQSEKGLQPPKQVKKSHMDRTLSSSNLARFLYKGRTLSSWQSHLKSPRAFDARSSGHVNVSMLRRPSSSSSPSWQQQQPRPDRRSQSFRTALATPNSFPGFLSSYTTLTEKTQDIVGGDWRCRASSGNGAESESASSGFNQGLLKVSLM